MKAYAPQPKSSWNSSLDSQRLSHSTTSTSLKLPSANLTQQPTSEMETQIENDLEAPSQKKWGTITHNVMQSEGSLPAQQSEGNQSATIQPRWSIFSKLHLGKRGAAHTSSHANPNIQQQTKGAPTKTTGLPNSLKAGIEQLSGYAMDDVRVHYNSPNPAQLFAHAYTQGTDIHLARGQEKHLPHEAWHVVQQKQGRVQPTLQTQDYAINDDRTLEQEADTQGYQANQMGLAKQPGGLSELTAQQEQLPGHPIQTPIVQRLVIKYKLDPPQNKVADFLVEEHKAGPIKLYNAVNAITKDYGDQNLYIVQHGGRQNAAELGNPTELIQNLEAKGFEPKAHTGNLYLASCWSAYSADVNKPEESFAGQLKELLNDKEFSGNVYGVVGKVEPPDVVENKDLQGTSLWESLPDAFDRFTQIDEYLQNANEILKDQVVKDYLDDDEIAFPLSNVDEEQEFVDMLNDLIDLWHKNILQGIYADFNKKTVPQLVMQGFQNWCLSLMGVIEEWNNAQQKVKESLASKNPQNNNDNDANVIDNGNAQQNVNAQQNANEQKNDDVVAEVASYSKEEFKQSVDNYNQVYSNWQNFKKNYEDNVLGGSLEKSKAGSIYKKLKFIEF